MSANGNPAIGPLDGSGLNVAIAASTWHSELCDQLLKQATAAARSTGAEVTVVRTSGAVELPVIVQQLCRNHDAVVALGVVVKGETPHFDYVCSAVTDGLTRISLDERTPVAHGVLTTFTLEQAVDRCGWEDSMEDKGTDATIAAIDSALKLAALRAEENRT